MSDPSFVAGLTVGDLGMAGEISLFGLRASACGRPTCCAVLRAFNGACGDDGPDALAAIVTFTYLLSTKGRRKVTLGMPGCGRITRDEWSFAEAFAATQARRQAARDSHVAWLFADAPSPCAIQALGLGAAIFSEHGLMMRMPVPETPGGAGLMHPAWHRAPWSGTVH